MFEKKNILNTLNGVLFVALFALAAIYLSNLDFLRKIGISPLIIGILIGVFYANTLRSKLPPEWVPGIQFSTKQLLRLAIILYGFRLSFQHIAEVGYSGLLIGIIIIATTFGLAMLVGHKWLKIDKETTMLIGAGSSICGAAAVLATEPVIQSKPYKSVLAVSTVVIFGTMAMFLYPLAYNHGLIPLSPEQMSLFTGATIHEVAHVVGAGNAMGPEIERSAIITKMIRVMMMAPFLILLSFYLVKSKSTPEQGKRKITIPWFAIWFIVMTGVNSLNLLPAIVVSNINALDNFLLTMAMTALGMETNLAKFKGIGFKPFYLAAILFLWLTLGGYQIAKIF